MVKLTSSDGQEASTTPYKLIPADWKWLQRVVITATLLLAYNVAAAESPQGSRRQNIDGTNSALAYKDSQNP